MKDIKDIRCASTSDNDNSNKQVISLLSRSNHNARSRYGQLDNQLHRVLNRLLDSRSHADGNLPLTGRGSLAPSPGRFEHRIGVVDIPGAWQAFVRLLVF